MTALHTLNIFSNGDVKKVDLYHYRVKEDWRTKRWGYQVRGAAPDPAIFPVSKIDGWPDTTFTTFSERWQWFACGVLSVSKYRKPFTQLDRAEKNYIISAFTAICGSDKALHNYHGVDVGNNYPRGEFSNPDGSPKAEDPMQESLIFSLADVYSDIPPRNGMVNIKTFYSNEIPPPVTVDILSDPRVQRMVIVNPDRTFQEFPQLTDDRNSPVHVYFPIITRGFDYSWFPLIELDVM